MHFPRIPTFVFFFFFLFLTGSLASLSAAKEPVKERPALSGKSCLTKPQDGWSKQEKWVWSQVYG